MSNISLNGLRDLDVKTSGLDYLIYKLRYYMEHYYMELYYRILYGTRKLYLLSSTSIYF